MVVLVAATLLALATLLGYFFTPVGLGRLDFDKQSTSPPGQPKSSSRLEGGFADVTAASGVHFQHTAGEILRDIRQVTAPGLGLADLDGDTRIDLFLVNSIAPGQPKREPNAVYLNRGGMKFEALPDAGGADSGEWGMGCAIADYDADGDEDVYVTALGPNRLYRNDGHARFEEIAERAGVADARWSTGAAFADYDLDGDLDLFVANYVYFDEALIPTDAAVRYDRDEPPAFSPYVFPAEHDALYRNDGDVFTDATQSSGIVDVDGKSMAVLFADLNRDRRPDLLVINDVSRDLFLLNQDGRVFSDAGLISGLADPRSGMGVAFGDYDADGAFDVFATHWQDESNVLYRNLGGIDQAGEAPVFEDVTIRVGLAAPSMGSTGWGASWADFDQDGDLDLLVVNGYTSPAANHPEQCIGQPAMLFINDAGQFTDRATELGLGELARWAARGAGTADLDDDGDLDIVIATNNGPLRVFENRLASGHWLKVKPSGGMVIGTVVRLHNGGRMQQRMIVSGSSYLCSEPPLAHFGLGRHARVERLEVCWPDGRITSLEDVPGDQTVVVHKS